MAGIPALQNAGPGELRSPKAGIPARTRVAEKPTLGGV